MRTNGIEVADIFRKYGKEFRKTYRLPPEQTSLMNLIEHCRTSSLGYHKDRCSNCGYENFSYNSCRNRHCPKCQHNVREKWIHQRESELLDVSYYHIVFTIPDILNPLVLINKRKLYGILFKAASETLITLGRDPKHLGADVGIIAVLQTWGQNLMDHPHLHCIVPGGGLTPDGRKWKHPRKAKFSERVFSKNNFFIHVNVISDLFKKKFLAYFKRSYKKGELTFTGKIKDLRAKKNFYELLNTLYEKIWITYCKKPFGGPKQVIEYLGRYTHKVAISNNRIKSIENGKVVFTYKDNRDNQSKEMRLKPVEFIRRFMLHVLPEGFFKIRYYGILSNRRKKWTLERCREVIAKLKLERSGNPDASENKTVNHERTYEQWIWKCPKCEKGIMNVVAFVIGKAPG